jgi:hypothetical protein
MEKEFVPYTLALEMKSIGFDEPCFGLYAPPSKTVFLHHYGLLSAKEQILAPLYQQAFRWFREKHRLSHYDIRRDYYISEDGVRSYDDIELACLKKLIQIVKEKL